MEGPGGAKNEERGIDADMLFPRCLAKTAAKYVESKGSNELRLRAVQCIQVFTKYRTTQISEAALFVRSDTSVVGWMLGIVSECAPDCVFCCDDL